MDDSKTATGTLEADEAILTYTVSDDALEAEADIERVITSFIGCRTLLTPCDGPLSLSSRLGLAISSALLVLADEVIE